MPSLHTAWALALVWQTRDARRPLRWITGLCLGWTIAATLGLGYHYVVDLVVAVPFLTVVRALSAWKIAGASRVHADALAGGLALLVGWLLLLRWGAELLASHVALTWTLSMASTLLAFALDVRLFATIPHGSSPIPGRAPSATERTA